RMVISDITSPVYNLLVTAAFAYAALRARAASSRLARGWAILTLAQFTYMLGDLTWAVLELGFNLSPFPSIADGPYLLYYPLFFWGVSQFASRSTSPLEWVKKTLDLSIVLVSACLGFWMFLIGPLLDQATATPLLERVLTVAYPTGDLVLLFALLMVLYFRADRQLTAPIWLLVSATLVTIIADSIYSYQTLIGIYQGGGILDFGWTIALILFALAGILQGNTARSIRSDDLASSQQSTRASERLSLVLTFLPYLWMIAAYILLIQRHWQTNLPISFENLFYGVGWIITFTIIRQIIALQENGKLLNNLRNALVKVEQQTSELDGANKKLRLEIAERSRIEAKLAHDSLHDSLTGLANRILFMDRLAHAVEINKRETGLTFSVLFLDIDNFKAINDGLGHLAGDRALVEVGQRLRRCMRSMDTIARFGGDEFVILLESGENHAAYMVAERILEEVNQPLILKESDVQINCSIGIVQDIAGYTNPEDILRDVDIALYRAKENGKARSEIFTLDMRTSTLALLATENDLRRAIHNNEFVLYFQPIYALEQNSITGFEALVRWQHPYRGLLLPAEFIQVAEQSGLIVPLGDWILHAACTQMRKWHMIYPEWAELSISVNISGKQINQPDFVSKVKQTLRLSGLDPHCLNLEITENTFIENVGLLTPLLNDLRSIGVTFMIDDFGTGYSSLGYLMNIPVKTIKIDKSFVDGIAAGDKGHEIVNAIITMAQKLGMDTIAEGIEDAAQLDKLKLMHCAHGQGYLFSRPLDVNQTENKLLFHN
ncbi:MAG: bifunctional diguanylate cyclase/phosphodiesterase, partial [Anaerolineae bacterium]|nr:bifunctional diguanylate cyclase/phosphodiesterase [Anaerolineae bacterium]